MHILLVSHYTLPHSGGIEVLVDEHARALVRQGHQVTVVSSRTGQPADEWRDGVHVVRVAAWNVLEERLHVPFPIFAPVLLAVLRRAVAAADVIHVHGFLYLGSWCALLWAWWFGKPLVVTEHVGFVPYRQDILNGIQRLALAATARVFLARADAVVTLKSTVLDWLARLTPYPERLHFVRNGIDTARFAPATPAEQAAAREALGIPAGRPVALFVGRFVEKKGVDKLLQAADGSFELVLCGRGEPPVAGPGVTVLLGVEHACMPDVYRAADVFVIASHGEGFPLAVMEAMACGLPVVAVRDASYDAYVSDAEMVQTAGDPDSLRAALRGLFADGAERGRRGAASRVRAERDFGLDAYAGRHVTLYEQARGFRQLSNALAPLGYDLATRIKAPMLRELIGEPPPGPRADIGPGSGYGAHHAFGPGPILAVDISHANLLALRTRAQAAGCPDRFLPVQADLTALPFRDGALKTILCAEVLEHMPDDHAAAVELIRVTAADGRLVVEVPNVARGYANYLERLGMTTVHDVPGPEFHHRPGYTPDTLAALFEPLGGRLAMQRSFAGFVSVALMDAVAAVHLVYERVRYGRSAWTWSDVHELAGSPVFRMYRAVFPFLRALARLDALLWPRVGFILGARVEKTPGRGGGPPGESA